MISGAGGGQAHSLSDGAQGEERAEKRRVQRAAQNSDCGPNWTSVETELGLNWSLLVCPVLDRADGWFPGVWAGEGRGSFQPSDLHQTASDRGEDLLLGESVHLLVLDTMVTHLEAKGPG